MNPRALALLFAVAAASPDPHHFRYQRPILTPPSSQSQTCIAMDATVFAHAAPQLTDLRLYRDTTETPYAISLAPPIAPAVKAIDLLNLGESNHSITFDAAMPEGRFSDIELSIHAQNFLASVEVSGSQAQYGSRETKLGSYTVFDLTDQKLGRSTVLHLPPSDFRYLHFHIDGPIKPQDVTGITIDRLPQNKLQYFTVAQSTQVDRQGKNSIIAFELPANVPVDRIEFAPDATPANFSRDVSVTVTPLAKAALPAEAQPETYLGNLLRIHATRNGLRIDEEHLAVETMQTSFQSPSKWSISIDNGDDAPLALKSVSLQMLARTLCFDVAPGSPYTLHYGDAALSAPRYDYASLFTLDKDATAATLGPEQENPDYQPRPDQRPLTERYPALLWGALVLVILLLGGIALRSAREVKEP